MAMSRSEAGRKGAEALNRDAGKKSEASKRAAATRGHESLAKAGAKGGSQSHGGGRSSQRDRDK